MEDERRRILAMVEQGRISAQEASDLLAALEDARKEPARLPEYHPKHTGGGGDRGWTGETVGNVVDAVMRALFGHRDRRRER